MNALPAQPAPVRPAPEAAGHPGRRTVAWIGRSDVAELAWARQRVATLADVWDAPGCELACDACAPALVLLACETPGRWTLADAVHISRVWPLAPLVCVAATLVEGRRRSGPPLPGVEELPWSDLPGRLAWWLADLDSGHRGTLGMPAAARREDRLLEVAARLAARRPAGTGPQAAVAASRSIDVDCTADLLTAAGYAVGRRTCGRPPLDEPADVLVWDVESLAAQDLAWLRMLTANRPGLRVVIVDSFPRCDSVQAALAAGAAAVLGRPLSLEALAGTLLSP